MWSYGATIFMVGAGIILLPFILHRMPAETVGIWNIFQTITTLVLLLDLGFRSSFARTISYIFSGVRTLDRNGVRQVAENATVDYSLLKGTITVMRRFYGSIALIVLVLLSTVGTAYFYHILQKYNGDHTDAIVAWILLIGIRSFDLYTFFYDALLTGKGYIRRTQQITMVGQIIYLLLAIGLIYSGFGLSAIIGAQVISTIVRRILAYRVFFTPEIRKQIEQAVSIDTADILRAIYPNAIKVGLTNIGAFMASQSAILMGSAWLSLSEVAYYGITMQVMAILARCASVTYQTYIPKIAQARAEKNVSNLARYFQIGTFSLIGIYIIGGALWMLLGNWALGIIHSETQFVGNAMLTIMLTASLLEQNHAMAAGFIMADNKIPFFIPSLLSGAATILLLWLFLGPLHWGIWGMILAPAIAQLCYQNWKWPSMVIKELFIDNK